jgi:hypothetical protein
MQSSRPCFLAPGLACLRLTAPPYRRDPSPGWVLDLRYNLRGCYLHVLLVRPRAWGDRYLAPYLLLEKQKPDNPTDQSNSTILFRVPVRGAGRDHVRERIKNKVLYSDNETNAKVWKGLREQYLIYRVWITCNISKVRIDTMTIGPPFTIEFHEIL